MKNRKPALVAMAVIGIMAVACNGPKETQESRRLVDLMPLFTAENVPETGPAEDTDLGGPFEWMSDRVTNPEWPGNGLAEHPMLFIGEGYNRIFVVDKGEVVWKYDTGSGWELDDVWMLKSGDILFSRMSWAAKVSPDKKELWRYDCNPGEEVHVIQPINDNEAFMLINGRDSRIVVFNHNTGEIISEKPITFNTENSHGQSRRMRYTREGTWLVCFLTGNKVVEYDKDMNEIRTFNVDKPWAAIRLADGNTLITLEDERRTIEVDRNDDIVWEYCIDELPEEYRIEDCQTVVRLQNGNTIFCSRGADGRRPQLVEITRDKRVVWVLDDWKNLGPATAVQILSEEGWSENPGDFDR